MPSATPGGNAQAGLPPSLERKAVLGGHNFGVLLPWWDMAFGTADFTLRYDPTGVRDQVEPDSRQGHVRDYGRGFWSQAMAGCVTAAGESLTRCRLRVDRARCGEEMAVSAGKGACAAPCGQHPDQSCLLRQGVCSLAWDFWRIPFCARGSVIACAPA